MTKLPPAEADAEVEASVDAEEAFAEANAGVTFKAKPVATATAKSMNAAKISFLI